MPGLRLVAELGGDARGFEAMMNAGNSAINSLKNQIAGLFTVGAITQLTRSTIEWASQLRDVADNLGVNVEWLQKMANGAKLVGANVEDIGKFIAEMNKSRGEALNQPAGKPAQALGRLGFSPADISGLSTQDFFNRIIEAFKNGATTQSVNDLQEVGGRTAKKLIAAFAQQFASDTPVLSEALIDQLDVIDDAFTSLATSLKVTLAPAIIAVGNAVREIVNFLKTRRDASTSAAAEFTVQREQYRKQGKGFFESIALAGEDAVKEFSNEIEKGEKAIDDIMAQENMGQRAAKAARTRRETGPPLFELDDKPEKTGAARHAAALKDSSNPFVRIGGMLGQTPGNVNNIASQHLKVAEETLVVQRAIYALFLRQNGVSPASSLNLSSNLGIPQ